MLLAVSQLNLFSFSGLCSELVLHGGFSSFGLSYLIFRFHLYKHVNTLEGLVGIVAIYKNPREELCEGGGEQAS